MYYVDTSAAAKLVLHEGGSLAMRRWAESHDRELCSSDILRVELQRVVRRHTPNLVAQARDILSTILLLAVSTEMCERAARVDLPQLRALDALHLVAAMEFGDELAGVVTYDERLADAAQANGIATLSPH